MPYTTKITPETPSQTAGPYVHIGLTPGAIDNPERTQEISSVLAKPDAAGEHITLKGKIYDGQGDLIKDAVIEVWQADSEGRYELAYDVAKPFNSFGRCALDLETGEWIIETVKPGYVQDKKGECMAPHITITLFARGINIHLQTRICFEDETEANQHCPVLHRIESLERRKTLMARRQEIDGKVLYTFDIHLQGDTETVFFDF